MSRGDLRALSMAPILIVAGLLLSGPACAACAACAACDSPVHSFERIQNIAKTYKIQIVTSDLHFPVKTGYGPIDGKNAERKELQDYISLFAPEFTLYPAELVQRSQLKCVVLCCELSFAGQRRNAIPDYEHDTLYLDVSRGKHNRNYLRKVIHHEFFHVIDYRDDGNVYQDERWASLNPNMFKYSSGGRDAQSLKQTSVLTDKFPGFLNHYSTTGVEEDKAEMFSNLIVEPEYVERRAKDDRVLNAKVERMKELLAAFSPEMNDKFWQKVRKVRRSDK
ncbi:hypothetical protein BH10PLA2_BH10PLA2_11360 [soil metagenome]